MGSVSRRKKNKRKLTLARNAKNKQKQIRCKPVKLAATDPIELADDGTPRWVQIAEEGDYPGYRRGTMPFSMDRAMFDQIVANFHNNPSYEAGEDGVGKARVVPWDFHHASEMDPTTGNIPTAGVPAQGWTYELQVRTTEEGVAQLWALTEFLEPARTYVKNGQYRWASVSIDPDCVDDATALKVGAVLTSVALTNQPVVKGMEKLVASRDGKISGDSYRWIDPAEDAGDALDTMKSILGLPKTAGLPELTAEMSRLRQLVSGVVSDPTVDVDDIVGAMRRLFNLPILEDAESVMDEFAKVIAVVVESQTVQPAAGQSPAMAASAATTNKENDVDLIKILASKLGVREADEAVKDAVGDLVALRTGMKRLLGAEADTSKELLESAERKVSAKTKLTTILKALQVEDPDAAVMRIADMMKQAEDLKAAMPELEGLRIKVAKQEEEQAEADVEEAIAANSYDPNLKEALLMLRKSDPEKFLASYPKRVPKQGEGDLLRAIVVNNPANPKAQPIMASQPVGGTVINLAMYPGGNTMEKAISYIKGTMPGSENWSWEQLCKAAIDLKKQPNVVNQG